MKTFIRKLKNVLAGTIAGLSILPAFRGATTEPERRPSTEDVDHIADSEIEATCFAAVRPEIAAKYDGTRVTLAQQLDGLSKMSGKGFRWRNLCFSGDAECQQFVADRTRG